MTGPNSIGTTPTATATPVVSSNALGSSSASATGVSSAAVGMDEVPSSLMLAACLLSLLR